MNRILTLGIAAVGTVLLSQPVYAENRGGGGGGRGGGGGGRAAAPAVHSAPAAHFSTHAIAPQHFATQSRPQFNFRSAPAEHFRTAPTVTPSVAQRRSFTQPLRNTPSVAFGGTAFNDRNAAVNAPNARSFANTQSVNRGNAGAFRPSPEVSRGWDRGRIQTWNHHHYRWYGGDWVLFDDGGYGYPYGYDDNGYSDQAPTPAVYDSSESVAVSVQSELAREGYNPGPVDGVIGGQTRDAITDFQYAHHMRLTGQIDGPLLQALGL